MADDPCSRASPSYVPPPDYIPEEEGDSEQRSVFVSQLAARLTARDLGFFFEDKLGDHTVRDARIVTDRLSKRSKGYVSVMCRSIQLIAFIELAMSSFVPWTSSQKPLLSPEL